MIICDRFIAMCRKKSRKYAKQFGHQLQFSWCTSWRLSEELGFSHFSVIRCVAFFFQWPGRCRMWSIFEVASRPWTGKRTHSITNWIQLLFATWDERCSTTQIAFRSLFFRKKCLESCRQRDFGHAASLALLVYMFSARHRSCQLLFRSMSMFWKPLWTHFQLSQAFGNKQQSLLWLTWSQATTTSQ